MVNKNIRGDNMVEKIMNVENRKWPPKNREVGDDLKDGEKRRMWERKREERRRGKEMRWEWMRGGKEMIAPNMGE